MINKRILKGYIGMNIREDMDKMNTIQKRSLQIKVALKNIGTISKIACRQYLFFPQIEIALTTRCSLRCRDCSNLMQFYDHPQDVDFDTNCKSVDNVLSAVDKIDRFILLGGEPFLYSRLSDILEKVIDAGNKVNRVWIYSNGTILPQEEKLISLMKNPKVTLFISNYGGGVQAT